MRWKFTGRNHARIESDAESVRHFNASNEQEKVYLHDLCMIIFGISNKNGPGSGQPKKKRKWFVAKNAYAFFRIDFYYYTFK